MSTSTVVAFCARQARNRLVDMVLASFVASMFDSERPRKGKSFLLKMLFLHPLSEYGFAYGLKTETRQFSTNFSCEPHGEGKETCLCPSTDRVRFRLFPSTVWAGREYGLDCHRKIKGRFRKRAVLANVLPFRFFGSRII